MNCSIESIGEYIRIKGDIYINRDKIYKFFIKRNSIETICIKLSNANIYFVAINNTYHIKAKDVNDACALHESILKLVTKAEVKNILNL